jgi:hypothetical protein
MQLPRTLHVSSRNTPKGFPTMTKMLPVIFALIPLAAMIGACVSCP